MPDAVIFDLDGVLLDSEQLWNEAKQTYVAEVGGTWRDDAPRAMMGMSAPEWTRYMRDELAVDRPLPEINDGVVSRIEAMYRKRLPLLPGAVDTVHAVAARWPVALASSSNRHLIDLFLAATGLGETFGVTVSSEEVERGKPSPDVYLAAADRISAAPARSIAVEDSSNGIRAAAAAGLRVVAIPNPHYPPDPDALQLAAVTVDATAEVTPELIARFDGS